MLIRPMPPVGGGPPTSGGGGPTGPPTPAPVPGATPPPGSVPPSTYPGGSSPPYRIGGSYGMPTPALQATQDWLMSQHGAGVTHPAVNGAGAGWEIHPSVNHILTNVTGSGPTAAGGNGYGPTPPAWWPAGAAWPPPVPWRGGGGPTGPPTPQPPPGATNWFGPPGGQSPVIQRLLQAYGII